NSDGGQSGNINVDLGAKLVLGTDVNAGGVTGGTVTVNSGGELDLTGQVLASGTLTNGTLTNTGQVNVSGTGNTLDHEIVSNTGNASAVDITGALTLKNGAGINNSTATSGETVESGATLTVQDGGISGGKVTNKGTLNLQGNTGVSDGKFANTGQV